MEPNFSNGRSLLWTEISARDSGPSGIWAGLRVGFVLVEGREEGSVEREQEANWMRVFEGRGCLLFIFVFLNLRRAWHARSINVC